MLEDFKTRGENIEQVAREMKNTLIAGPGQKQGAWGQMVLEFILSKLEFTEGQQYETQKSIQTEEGRQIPDVIVHFPDNRDVVIDSKVSLTAWDEYVNSEDSKVKDEALKTVADYKNALSLLKKDKNSFNPKVTKCSALKKVGINEIWKIILSFKSLGNKKGWIKEKRSKQLAKWMWDDLQKNLFEKIKCNKKLASEFAKLQEKVSKNVISPTEASKKILQHYAKNNKR